ncbi:MDR family MFS transporter [Brevibacillus laterosporus]|uniref:MDR family MFS transporter n=1 Tax=Brevibacillus laterosporus TaxID=1465 RepID=UPI000CE4AA94|nr:MFS transporter [Brevibacillus laterosporus]MED1662808.1 MFS transporter [Brevibacillus laterosporus]MED1669066.1 MFS transporter [Brevibacillus laterosporus]MED1720541.1 MFS transporter [Brevibacillus laterosporus]PPA88388.1 MFS transporter [Brevibacillus laterosporus]
MLQAWKEFHPVVKLMLIGSVLMNIGNGMIIPYFAIYLGEHTNLSITQIGFLIGSSSLAAMFGGFLGGTLSDLIGRKKVMMASLILSAIMLIGLTFHPFPSILMLVTIGRGFTMSFFEPCSKALIADLTKSGKRLRAFSMKYFCGNLGLAIGPLLGTFLGLQATSTLPFYISCAVFLLYSLVLHLLFAKYKVTSISAQQEKVTFRASMKAMGRDKILFLFLLGGLVATTVHGQFSVTLSQYFYSDLKSAITFLGILWSAHAVVIILLSVPIIRLMEKRSTLQSIVIGTSLFCVGIVGFAFSHGFTSFLISMIVFTIGEIFLIPAEYAIIDEITPDHIRGTYFGAVSFTALGSFIGPGLSGMILSQFNGLTMFLFLALLSLVSIIFYFWGIRLKEQSRSASLYE